MCLKEFLGYACGHCSMPQLRTCPLTDYDPTFPPCSIPAERVIPSEENCPGCSRAQWNNWVLYEEEAHRQFHLNSSCNCGVIFHSDSQASRKKGNREADQGEKRRDAKGEATGQAQDILIEQAMMESQRSDGDNSGAGSNLVTDPRQRTGRKRTRGKKSSKNWRSLPAIQEQNTTNVISTGENKLARSMLLSKAAGFTSSSKNTSSSMNMETSTNSPIRDQASERPSDYVYVGYLDGNGKFYPTTKNENDDDESDDDKHDYNEKQPEIRTKQPDETTTKQQYKTATKQQDMTMIKQQEKTAIKQQNTNVFGSSATELGNPTSTSMHPSTGSALSFPPPHNGPFPQDYPVPQGWAITASGHLILRNIAETLPMQDPGAPGFGRAYPTPAATPFPNAFNPYSYDYPVVDGNGQFQQSGLSGYMSSQRQMSPYGRPGYLQPTTGDPFQAYPYVNPYQYEPLNTFYDCRAAVPVSGQQGRVNANANANANANFRMEQTMQSNFTHYAQPAGATNTGRAFAATAPGGVGLQMGQNDDSGGGRNVVRPGAPMIVRSNMGKEGTKG